MIISMEVDIDLDDIDSDTLMSALRARRRTASGALWTPDDELAAIDDLLAEGRLDDARLLIARLRRPARASSQDTHEAWRKAPKHMPTETESAP